MPIKYLLTKLTGIKVMEAPHITKKTLELGTKYSPGDVCIPFKYNLGNYIESLDMGATILVQAGGGCRYRYYGEVQEEILKNMGYKFKFIKLNTDGKLSIIRLYKSIKELNPRLYFFKYIYYFVFCFIYLIYMDKVDKIIRKNIGFEVEKNSFVNKKRKMLREFSKCRFITTLTYKYFVYKKRIKRIPIDKPTNCLKVGIIGELYTSMEPFASYFLEEELAKMNIEIKRFTNLTYLLFEKRFFTKYMLYKCRKYCKYTLGADGLDNVYRTIILSKKYDGIIHIKPFACTPEVGAIPIIQKVAHDKKIPIIFFSFDCENETEGIITRLEAFYDLLKFRKENK